MNSPTPVQDALKEALELGLELAQEAAADVHERLKGYKPDKHAAADADVLQIQDALALLAAQPPQQNAAQVRDATEAETGLAGADLAFRNWIASSDNPIGKMKDSDHPLPITFVAGWNAALSQPLASDVRDITLDAAESSRLCRQAYENRYHKIAALCPYDEWLAAWNKCLESMPKPDPTENERIYLHVSQEMIKALKRLSFAAQTVTAGPDSELMAAIAQADEALSLGAMNRAIDAAAQSSPLPIAQVVHSSVMDDIVLRGLADSGHVGLEEVDVLAVAQDSERLDWMNTQIVDVIYLDDGRIIDVRGNDVRKAIDAARKAKS